MIVQFGIGINQEKMILTLLDQLPAEFRELEITGEMLDNSKIRSRISQLVPDRFELTVHHLISAELAQLVPTQKLMLQLEFIKLFRARCQLAAELKARDVGMSFPLERAIGDVEYAANLLKLLRSCWGILAEFNLTLRFSLRLPLASGMPDLPQYIEFLRKCSYPATAFALELNPLTPGMMQLNQETLKPLRFHNDFWRIEFPIAEQYQIDMAAIKQICLEYSELLPGKSRIIIAPIWLNGEEWELESLTNIVAPLFGKEKFINSESIEGDFLLC